MRKQKHGPTRPLRNFSIGQLELLHRHYHWARDRVLREQGLRHVHLTMIRLIRLRGSVTLHELRQVTGYSRSAMNKHRDFLVECKLIKELPRKGDKRMVHLGCTERGRRRLEEIDDEIERRLMKGVGFTRRTELKAFAVKLEEALREFPQNATSGRWAYSVAADKKLAAGPDGQLLPPTSLPATPSEKSSPDQGNGVSGESQFDPDCWPS